MPNPERPSRQVLPAVGGRPGVRLLLGGGRLAGARRGVALRLRLQGFGAVCRHVCRARSTGACSSCKLCFRKAFPEQHDNDD